jgi:outer membrane biosynthesis protein TonB
MPDDTRSHSKGWIGTLAIHGALAAVLVMFSGLRGQSEPEIKPMGSLVINLDGDGSPAPGAGGGSALIPKGVENGNPDSDAARKALEEEIKKQNEADAREEERRRKEEAKPKPPVPVPDPKPDPKLPPVKKPPVPAKDSGKPELVSLDAIIAQRNAAAKNAKKSTNSKTATTTAKNTNGSGKTGVDVSRIIGIGGTGPLGVAYGSGPGGNPNGGGAALANYEDRLKLLIQAQWQQLIDREGNGRIPSGMSGEFKLTISRNGSLSFGGWVRSPGNALFESLLRRAIDAVGRNGGSPPPGVSSLLIFEIIANSN